MNIIKDIESVCEENGACIIYDISGPVLFKTCDNLFNLYLKTHEEIKGYCHEKGFDIQKIVFATCYDSTINNDYIDKHQIINLKMNSGSRLTIYKDTDNQLTAYVVISTRIIIK